MQEIFPENGIDFTVHYMAHIEPNRKWIIPEDSYKYKYKIHKGLHPAFGRFYAHFNPSIITLLLKKDYDFVIIGGMGSPSHWLSSLLTPKSKFQIMSIESNLHSTNRKDGIGAWFKRLLLKRANAFQVTGKPQIEYINYFDPKSKNKKFIKLPNLIDEKIFRDQVKKVSANRHSLRNDLKLDEKTQAWILPAQLIELKGIMPFLKLLRGIQNIKVFILGDGILKKTIQEEIDTYNLPVVLEGYLQQDRMIDFYAIADLFVLPSLKDSSPLTPIEACAASLPILVSSRIGNVEDVLTENLNGWKYDPIDEEIKGKEIISEIARLTLSDLKTKGKKSLEIYNLKFDTKKRIQEYAVSLKNLLKN
ncbi:glycosyltransferase family 4 protein [Dokdonia ponticola]|uniref:Glycosyltransferase family 4 protein n=1 Tax=Dokdonia ponticola TaxID=2041041 RepID=A0ABV9HTZ4_9FLAO